MHPGNVGYIVSFQTADRELVTERSCEVREERNVQGFHTINLKGVDVLCVVAPGEAAALRWAQPMVALAKRELVIQQEIRHVGFNNPKVVRGWNGS